MISYSVVYHLAYDLVILVIPLVYVLSEIPDRSQHTALHRCWTVMVGVLIGWAWFGDHAVQLIKRHHVAWVIHAYPYYYAALAAWLYATAEELLIVGASLGLGSKAVLWLQRSMAKSAGSCKSINACFVKWACDWSNV